MEQHSGTSIFKGIAIGRIWYYEKERRQVNQEKAEDAEAEVARYEDARDRAVERLGALQDKAVGEAGEGSAMIFQAHAMLLKDEEFNDFVCTMIRKDSVNAEFAVASAGDTFSSLFAEMEDEYFKARAADIKDVSEQVLDILQGYSMDNGDLGMEPVILVAEDLTPSETVQLDKNRLLAFVTKRGSSYSHTAILARTMNIPGLVGVEIDRAWHGKMAVVDGGQGLLILDPEEATLEKYREARKKEAEFREHLSELKNQSDVTADGREILLYANIGGVADVADVLACHAAGIGLFRTEFLYLEKDRCPTEEEQFQVYRTVAGKMEGRKVIIRTMDIGADKQADYFHMEREENPAMGCRAIRICLERVELFKAQLRAIYRASAFGDISILFPMIISVKEVQDIKKICGEVRRDLMADGIAIGEVELGIMVETPAAALISDLLAKEVDFFSIGTNDLTQYTLAIDRQNPKLEGIYDPHHPAVLRMIQMVIDNGHREGCRVGICGELGADTTLTETWIRMGMDELSVSPSMVLPVRKAIREAGTTNPSLLMV